MELAHCFDFCFLIHLTPAVYFAVIFKKTPHSFYHCAQKHNNAATNCQKTITPFHHKRQSKFLTNNAFLRITGGMWRGACQIAITRSLARTKQSTHPSNQPVTHPSCSPDCECNFQADAKSLCSRRRTPVSPETSITVAFLVAEMSPPGLVVALFAAFNSPALPPLPPGDVQP
jgi:hypothetical protein